MTEGAVQTERRVSGLGLSSGEKIKILGIFVSIICATVFGFIASTIIGNMSVVLAGLGVVAFVFGLRHGVDADHIANMVFTGTLDHSRRSDSCAGFIDACHNRRDPNSAEHRSNHWHGGFRNFPLADRSHQCRYRIRDIQDLQTAQDRSAEFRTA
jgi:hypothetical protein